MGFNEILDFIKVTIGLCFIIAISIFFIITGIFFVNYVDYHFNESQCVAFVNKKEVYKGRCHFLGLQSVGENGNTKILIVYKDKIKLKAIKQFASNDIEVLNAK